MTGLDSELFPQAGRKGWPQSALEMGCKPGSERRKTGKGMQGRVPLCYGSSFLRFSQTLQERGTAFSSLALKNRSSEHWHGFINELLASSSWFPVQTLHDVLCWPCGASGQMAASWSQAEDSTPPRPPQGLGYNADWYAVEAWPCSSTMFLEGQPGSSQELIHNNSNGTAEKRQMQEMYGGRTTQWNCQWWKRCHGGVNALEILEIPRRKSQTQWMGRNGEQYRHKGVCLWGVCRERGSGYTEI